MPRLESTAVAGYYPTPPRVTASITRHLAPTTPSGKQVVRILDPCAGRGEAVANVGHALNASTYGVELNEDRAGAARNRLDHVVTGSAFAVRLTNGAFSCLWLNPPYSDDAQHGRLEHGFLTTLTRALCPGGLLIFLIPQRRLAISARYLSSHYTGFSAYRFPDPEVEAFGQMVLFATRKRLPMLDQEAQRILEAWSSGDLSPLPDVPDGAPYRVPALPAGDILFASLFFDPEQAAEEARRRGAWTQPQLAEQLWPPDERPVRPLMPLRSGHLALLIAAGMLNNVVLHEGDQRVLVKGRTRKEFVVMDSAAEDTVVEREVIQTSVMALDLTTGAMEVIEQGARPAGEESAA